MNIKTKEKRKEKFILLFLLFMLLIKFSIYGLDSYIYILDTGNNRIQKFDITGNFLLKFGSKGTGEAQFNYPAGIAISSDINLIYVADTANNRVQVFDKDGNFIKIFKTKELSNPNSIAVNNEDGKDFIYITDTGHNSILKYDFEGEFIYMLGELRASIEDGKFNNPQGITANKDFIYVSDTGNHRIQKFNINGSFVLKWGGQGQTQGKFNYPRDIAVDGSGFVYVVDSQNYRVQKFTENGDFVLEWGSKGISNGEFSGHFGIATDEKNFIYVADAGNNRVQKFTENGIWVETYGTTTKSAEPGLFYYPQGIEISYRKVLNTETPTFTMTITEILTFSPTETITFEPTLTEVSTPTFTQIQTQEPTEVNTPVSEITPVQNPGHCRFVKVGEIKWNFFIPVCATMDKKENIYILDLFSKCIFKFNKEGILIKKINSNLNDNNVIENMEYDIEIIDRNENTESYETDNENLYVLIKNNLYPKIIRVFINGGIIEKTNIKISAGEIIKNFALNKNGNIYMANGYKGEIKIFNKDGELLKIVKNFKKMFWIHRILVDDNGFIYLIDKIKGKIYKIKENQNNMEEFDFYFKKFPTKYLYFIKDNNLYIVEINKNNINILKQVCIYETESEKIKEKKNNYNYNILMAEKKEIIVNYDDMDEKEIYNYPNPCKGTTTIRFITYKKQDIKVVIYDINGRLVWEKMLNASEVRDGLNEIIFMGKNENGFELRNGVYIYKIIAGDKIITKKMVIMK